MFASNRPIVAPLERVAVGCWQHITMAPHLYEIWLLPGRVRPLRWGYIVAVIPGYPGRITRFRTKILLTSFLNDSCGVERLHRIKTSISQCAMYLLTYNSADIRKIRPGSRTIRQHSSILNAGYQRPVISKELSTYTEWIPPSPSQANNFFLYWQARNGWSHRYIPHRFPILLSVSMITRTPSKKLSFILSQFATRDARTWESRGLAGVDSGSSTSTHLICHSPSKSLPTPTYERCVDQY